MYLQQNKHQLSNLGASSSGNTSKTRLHVNKPATLRQTFTQDYQKFTTNIAQRVHSRDATLRQSDIQNSSNTHAATMNNSQTALIRPQTSSGHSATMASGSTQNNNVTLISNKENNSLNLVLGRGQDNTASNRNNLRNTNQSLATSAHNEQRSTGPSYMRSTTHHATNEHNAAQLNTMTMQMPSRGATAGASAEYSGKRVQSNQPEESNFQQIQMSTHQILKRPASKQQQNSNSANDQQNRRRYPHQQVNGATRRLNEEIQQKIQVLTNSIGQIKPESLNRSGSTAEERIGSLKSGVLSGQSQSNRVQGSTKTNTTRSSQNLSRFTSGFQHQQKQHASIVTPQTLKPQIDNSHVAEQDSKYKPIQISKRQGHGSREPTKQDRFISHAEKSASLINKQQTQINQINASSITASGTTPADYSTQNPTSIIATTILADPNQTVTSTTHSGHQDQQKEYKRSRTSDRSKGAVSNATAVALAAKRIQSSLRSNTNSTQNIQKSSLTQQSSTTSNNKLENSIVAITTQASSTYKQASASSGKMIDMSCMSMEMKIQEVSAIAEERRKDRMKALTRNFEVCDLLDMRNVQTVAEHAPKITQYLLTEECRFMLPNTFMKNQDGGVTEKMRAFLVDWLAELHFKFKMWPETLYVTIGIIDKFLAISTNISKQELQILGITALLVAGKYEEIYPPDLKTILKVINNVRTKEEVLKMEQRVLLALQFDITFPSMFRFIERFARLAQMNERQVLLSQYFADTALLDCSLVREKPSKVAACCIYASQKIFKGPSSQKGVLWNSMLSKHTGYRESDISGMASDLLAFVSKVEKSTFQTMKKKYSSSRYSEVAKLMQNYQL